MKAKIFYTFGIVLIAINCSSLEPKFEVKNPHPKKPILIEHDEASCEANGTRFVQWTALFSAIRIYPQEPYEATEMFPEDDASYKIVQKSTWDDIVVSFFLGYIATISKRSLFVYKCKPKLLDGMCLEKTKNDSGKTCTDFLKTNYSVISLKSGQKIQGNLANIEEGKATFSIPNQEITLSSGDYSDVQQDTSIDTKEETFIVLKSGERISAKRINNEETRFIILPQVVTFSTSDYKSLESNIEVEKKEEAPKTNPKSKNKKK